MTEPMGREAPKPDGTPGEIVVVRHGETAWTLNGRHTSRSDIPLTAHGEEQARELNHALAGRRFGLVLTSPRRRSLQTSAIAGFASAEVDPDLVEWDYGTYEGLTTPEISAANGGGWDLWRDGVKPTADGAGEQSDDIQRRAEAIIRRTRDTLDRGEDVLLFSHGHFLRAFAATWIGAPLRMGASFVLDTAGIATLGFEHDNQVIRQWNCPASGGTTGAGAPSGN
jgi:broad specificity phosphatase PhoE